MRAILEIAFIFAVTGAAVRVVDLATEALSRRKARRRLQRIARLERRRRTWDEIDAIKHDMGRLW